MNSDWHTVIESLTALGTLVVFIVGLMIKAAQAKSRAELLDHQSKVKDDLLEKHSELLAGQTSLRSDFDQKHTENREAINIHTAEDDQRFTGISRTLKRIDGKLEQISQVAEKAALYAPRRRKR